MATDTKWRFVRYGDENEALMDAGQQALTCQSVSSSSAISKVLGQMHAPIATHTTIIDADMHRWVDKKGRFRTECGAALMKELLLRPCTPDHLDTLETRMRIISNPTLHVHRMQQLLDEAKHLEKDCFWVLEKPDIKTTWPLPFLFPTMIGFNQCNKIPLFHEAYHFCRLIASPVLTVLYPMALVIGPWIYLRYKMKWALSFAAYIKFAYSMMTAIKGTVAAKMWISLGIYVALYLYSVAQVIDLARMVGQARQTLVERQVKVKRLLSIASSLKSMCGGDAGIAAFCEDAVDQSKKTAHMAEGFLGIWQWWGKSGVTESIRKGLQVIAVADIVATGASCLQKRHWTQVSWETDSSQWPRFYGMRHPNLELACVANPAALDKNIILTGPNAAGKTTYCRGLLANILLAQTLGIVCARRATMGTPFTGIISFMRISDETGTASLFEAEVARCVEMWKVAEQHEKVFMVLDEPMHATPPIEGAAAAMAFMKGLAKMGTVRVIATTHYAALTGLAFENPKQFVNISMEAIVRRGKPIAFPYSLRSGPSFQSIALELMHEQGIFPNAFIEDALKIKEKIGGREIVVEHG